MDNYEKFVQAEIFVAKDIKKALASLQVLLEEIKAHGYIPVTHVQYFNEAIEFYANMAHFDNKCISNLYEQEHAKEA